MSKITPKITIEVCVDSIDSALAAVNGGADRLELCGNLGLGGGTTPSTGLLKAVQRAVPNTPIMAMVRPRTGDFKYSKTEIDVMIEDIRIFKELSIAGVVFGVLTCGGRVDVGKTELLVQEALPMQVCFHRAFDMTIDWQEAIRSLSAIHGITRILSSGHEKTIFESSKSYEIFRWIDLSRDIPNRENLRILAGSGINPTTVRSIVSTLLHFKWYEIHLTGGRWVEGGMWHRPKDMDMGMTGHEWDVWRTSEEAIKEVRAIADEKLAKSMA